LKGLLKQTVDSFNKLSQQKVATNQNATKTYTYNEREHNSRIKKCPHHTQNESIKNNIKRQCKSAILTKCYKDLISIPGGKESLFENPFPFPLFIIRNWDVLGTPKRDAKYNCARVIQTEMLIWLQIEISENKLTIWINICQMFLEEEFELESITIFYLCWPYSTPRFLLDCITNTRFRDAFGHMNITSAVTSDEIQWLTSW